MKESQKVVRNETKLLICQESFQLYLVDFLDGVESYLCYIITRTPKLTEYLCVFPSKAVMRQFKAGHKSLRTIVSHPDSSLFLDVYRADAKYPSTPVPITRDLLSTADYPPDNTYYHEAEAVRIDLPLDCDHEDLRNYILSMEDGQRVQEFGISVLQGRKGTVYRNTGGHVCIMWDKLEGEEGQMGTTFTGGARRIKE